MSLPATILSLILFLAGLGLILWAYIRTGKASHKLPHDLSNPNRPTPSRGRYADIYDHVGCCYRCTKEEVERHPLNDGEFDWRMSRMFLCARCGNKRCPHATDHRLACTDSNAPGQAGSNYGPPIWDHDIGAEVPIGSTPKPFRGERGSHACPIARGGGRDHG